MADIADGAERPLIGKDPHSGTSRVARSEHEGAPVGAHGLEQAVVVRKVVFEIGVLDEHDVAGSRLEAGPNRGPLPARAVLPDHMHVMGGGKLRDGFTRSVSRVALDDDDFLVGSVERLGNELIEDVDDRAPLVIDGDDDADERTLSPDAGTRQGDRDPRAIGRRGRLGDFDGMKAGRLQPVVQRPLAAQSSVDGGCRDEERPLPLQEAMGIAQDLGRVA